MVFLFGWKDILRPIRDGYRHLFPSPDTGPTPEEREKQRRLDRLKGFTYFDTFAQLEEWTESESDPIQRANTPLLNRSSGASTSSGSKANVLLCHDFAGNYQDYEASTNISVDGFRYYCEYLQYVESFVYFSHKLVCVPPPPWTNTLHRNGVKVFGTLLIEPQTESSDRLLRSTLEDDDGQTNETFPLARKLAQIARHYGFDGWLVNIEKPFTRNVWDPELVEAFLGSLKGEMGDVGELIWYDALTTGNTITYQNALTPKNLPFAIACGAVLTNYCWGEHDALESKDFALKRGMPLDKVYFGIDVWAQNRTKLTQPRTTYPVKGGGGTNTGVAVCKIAEIGFSAGMFAPAWSFEHFPRGDALCDGLSIDRAMWLGHALPRPPFQVTCSCGDTSRRHPANPEFPITGSATHFPAGSERFFFTDFSMPFTHHSEDQSQRIFDGKKLHSQLGAQSILPHPPTENVKDDQGHEVDGFMHHIQNKGSKAYLHITAGTRATTVARQSQSDREHERHLSLFKLDMPADGSLQLIISSLCLLHNRVPNATTSFYLKFTNGIKYIRLEDTAPTNQVQVIECPVTATRDEDEDKNVRVLELGVHVRSYMQFENPTPVMDIYEIRIVPRVYPGTSQQYSIQDAAIERHGEGDTEHWRLRWSHQGEHGGPARTPPGVPYSKLTGPFSYFAVQVDGVDLGRAYALEYVLPERFVKSLSGGSVKVILIGVGFDGREVARFERGDVELPR